MSVGNKFFDMVLFQMENIKQPPTVFDEIT